MIEEDKGNVYKINLSKVIYCTPLHKINRKLKTKTSYYGNCLPPRKRI